MTSPCVLLVDDQKDIVRLLHSTLQTLGHTLDIVDAPSGEEALLEASRRKVDLLVSDYLLPGISGVELMRKVKARNPELKVIFISGMNERKARNEMLSAGAMAIFDKPIPLADFLDAVERGLGLVRTIFPPEAAKETEGHRQTLSELLTGFRQKVKADAVFLINDRGRVLARAGDLYDSSMEVSMLSALMGIYSAGLKVSRFIRQERLESYHVFRGGDHDLILIPVDSSHALLLAGKDLASRDRIMQTVEGMLFVRGDVGNILQSLGVASSAGVTEPAVPAEEPGGFVAPFITEEESEPEPEVDVEALFASAEKKSKVKDVNAFWDDAVEKAGNIPLNPDVISFEEANKLGLTPGQQGATIPRPVTGALKMSAAKKK
ncbi:MAG TPA: response regulator [Anaerolineales bacterium]|jgi:CheY-like chemotaxis protein|nr:response regulator [Anaerolineales bacterium]HQX16707.1 response regulator [Anaerolineales bacterium]